MSTPAAAQHPIPTFTVDLSRPPRERYNEIVDVFGQRMRSLTGLWEDLLSSFIASAHLRSFVTRVSKTCLRRVYDEEENEEIRGIAARSGVPLYLMVALNSLLDCLMGCTSGAARVREHRSARLMHFRTLDWGMHGLRDLLVVLEFVDSSSAEPGRVIARSITYAGFVGSLTMIKKDLSVSLNHRACHSCPTRSLVWHQMLVLLGRRRSVGSIIRALVMPQRHSKSNTIFAAWNSGLQAQSRGLSGRAKALAAVPSAPCYLILCDGEEAAVIVKDCISGSVETSRDFIAQTNHDQSEKTDEKAQSAQKISSQERHEVISSSFGIDGWVEESTDRLRCIQRRWDRHARKLQAGDPRSRSRNVSVGCADEAGAPVSITEQTLRRWISDYPTMNECSHFTTILDPGTGKIRWLERGPPPEEGSD